jgi:hypothetical protein
VLFLALYLLVIAAVTSFRHVVYPAVTAINNVMTSDPSEYFDASPVMRLTSLDISLRTRVLSFC